MSAKDKIFFGAECAAMQPCPINPAWIIEGAPIARNQLLSRSTDGSSCTLIWDCTGGLFNWHYDVDETVFILEGDVTVRDDDGVEHHLGPGDTAIFRKGSHAVWRVDEYVRKVAFCRNPLPESFLAAKSLVKKILEMAGLRRPAEAAPAMFGG